jgi:glutaconate CoA-transferase subunit A
VNLADEIGNAMVLGPDSHFDDLFLGAAERRFVTAERIVPAGTLGEHGPLERASIHRLLVDEVAPAPRGAHFTSNPPDYDRDEAFQRAYVAAAKDPESWSAFVERFLAGDEAAYQSAVDAWRSES